jgi:hypothetical protein
MKKDATFFGFFSNFVFWFFSQIFFQSKRPTVCFLIFSQMNGADERLSRLNRGGNAARDVPQEEEQQQRHQVRMSDSALLPKDPSLAELVDKVRHNLDLVASMHDSMSVENNEDGSSLVIERDEPVCSDSVKTVPAVDKLVLMTCEEKSAEKTAEKAMLELLEEFAEEEAQLHEVPRPESALSDEFMVVTPASTDSCVHFSIEDFEAAVSELDSEDTVKNPTAKREKKKIYAKKKNI